MSAAPPAGQNRHGVYMSIIVATAIAASLVMVFGVFGQQQLVDNAGDPYHYGQIARGFNEHGFDVLTRRAASLYPHLIAVVYRLGGNDLAVVLLQAALHACTCLLVFSLGRRIYNLRTGLMAAMFCALHPMLLRYVPDLHMETLLTFGCVLTVWLTVRFHDSPTALNGFLLGATGMLTVLTKGVILPYLCLFGAISGLAALRRKSLKEVLAVAVMFATMAAVLAPWTYRNYQVTGGRFVLLTPGTGDSFLRGYVFTRMEFATLQKPPYTDAENEVNAWFRQIAKDAGTTWEADEVADEQNNMRVARQMIREHPLDTARKVVVGLFTFWYEMTSLKTSLVPAVLAIGGWILAAVGLRRSGRERRPAWLLWLPIVVMNVFVATLIPLGRYSVPIVPCLMLLAAFGVDTLLARRGGRAVDETAVG
jgi:4-amino-4-deoxy-L-arabinose transferase-like glycosyltransferase